MRGVWKACLIKGAHHLLDSGAIPYLEHLNCSSEGQCRQQLGCQQEALRGSRPTSTLYKLHENLPFIDWVHALVDLIYHPERTDCHVLHAQYKLTVSRTQPSILIYVTSATGTGMTVAPDLDRYQIQNGGY